jgi:hypothetical protein
MSGYVNSLRLVKWRFLLTFAEETNMPPFVGNTIRGALGKSLCDNFPAAYNAVFKVSAGGSIPNPFVISAPYPSKEFYQTGESLEFAVTLFGAACGFADDIIGAAKRMSGGKLSGTNLSNVTCEYSREWSDAGVQTIPPYGDITIHFVTPTELLRGKEPVCEPSFGTLIDSLFGRIAGIVDHYGESAFVLPYSLFADKPLVKAEFDLKQVKISLNKQPINGFTGTARYRGDITPYLPYIDLGSQIHIGKKTTRSCGEYIFEL